MSFCLRSSSVGPFSTVVMGSRISDMISARTGTRLVDLELILQRGSMMHFTRLWLTWSMINSSWSSFSTALLKYQWVKMLFCPLLPGTYSIMHHMSIIKRKHKFEMVQVRSGCLHRQKGCSILIISNLLCWIRAPKASQLLKYHH